MSKCSWFSRFLVTIGQVAVAQSVAHSIVSNKKTSTVSEGKSKAHHGSQVVGGKGGAAAASSGDGTSQVSVLGERGGEQGAPWEPDKCSVKTLFTTTPCRSCIPRSRRTL